MAPSGPMTKHERMIKLTVLLLTLLLSAVQVPALSLAFPDGTHQTPEGRATYTPHAFISVVSDQTLRDAASANSWPGDGTEGDPYIIEGYSIDGNGSEGTCISIEGVTLHLTVRGNLVYSAAHGITVAVSRNVTVEGNEVRDCTWRGIAVWWCQVGPVEVRDNTVSNTSGRSDWPLPAGILVEKSKDVVVAGNRLVDNFVHSAGPSVLVDASDTVTVASNDVHATGPRATVSVVDSLGVTLANNTLDGRGSRYRGGRTRCSSA